MTRAYRPIRDDAGAYVQDVICDYPTTPKAGDVVRCGTMIGYALTDEDSDGYTTVDFGPREIEGKVVGGGTGDGDDLAAGSKVYFDDSSNPLTGDDSGNVFAGYALGAVDGSGNATINVLLGGN